MSYRVLVVDDSKIIRTAVKRSIGMAGIDVGQYFEAGDGLEALDVLAQQWIDIVFVDLNMPRMGGEEMVEQMAKDSLLLTVPVVVVSSDQSEARMANLKRKGVRAYIKKPFRPEHFRDVVSEILGGNQR